MTASSSEEAEFIAVFAAAKAVWHLRFVPQEMGCRPQEGPVEIHINNKAAPQTTNDNQAPTIEK